MFLKKNYIKFFILLTVCFLFFVGSSMKVDRTVKDETYKELGLLSDTLYIIQTQYVEESKPKDLIYGTLRGMLSALDPYSEFLDPQEYNELKSDTEGKFSGVGMEITTKDGLITVISPIENTPAWNAGIKTGDIIVKIDDKVLKDYTLNDAVRALRGKPGTEVKITIWRQGVKELLELKITRAIIKIDDIKDVRIIEPGIGYIRLVEFSEETPNDLALALEDLKKKGMKALVLDVRNNPGGLLTVAAQVAEMFLDENKLIVSTKGKADVQTLEFRSKHNSPHKDLLMVIMVNEGSASGSEILAGALQDYRRAIIVGRKTFGKGSVQTIIPLSDGSAVKLTTSKYFTPLGRSIQGEGIEPDINVEPIQLPPGVNIEQDQNVPEEIAKVFGLDNTSGDLFMKKYKLDNQLMRAVAVLKGLLIYTSSQQ
ncbi:MAG: S41 family peptidase [Candidatus Omnitrophica bacterium]|nr:S41 family peptidase [Candidatus Omnitrophota bacterium]MDD5352581.1 S41 family peptidase [Candidatus Omnitrophota bacterium]MDD5550179.1 S41 family peptidase [Candidatus Omnitrophota bacterium]